MTDSNDTDTTDESGVDSASAGSRWKAVDTLPTEDGWYLGNFNGAMRCIGFDDGKFDFWGTPSDQRPEDLTHWAELPSL